MLKEQHILDNQSKVFLMGDVHGDTAWAKGRVKEAAAKGCNVIFQLGDFGIWPKSSGDRFLKNLNKCLNEYDIDLFFVDGNHEDFPKLERLSKRLDSGFNELQIPYSDDRNRIFHIPRGHVFKVGPLTFQGVGGGVSIDKEYRIIGESWWPQEQLTPQQIEYAKENGHGKNVDVLLSHDCPLTVPMTGMKNDIESYLHRRTMSEIADVVKPRLWFHGHMHMYMEYEYKSTKVYGLSRNTFSEESWFPNAWGVLNLKTLEFLPEKEFRWLDKAY